MRMSVIHQAHVQRLCRVLIHEALPYRAIKNPSLYRKVRSSGLLKRCCRCGPTKLKAAGKSPWIQIQRMTKSPRPFWALRFVLMTTGPFVNSYRKRTFYYFEQQGSRFSIERQIKFTNAPAIQLARFELLILSALLPFVPSQRKRRRQQGQLASCAFQRTAGRWPQV